MKEIIAELLTAHQLDAAMPPSFPAEARFTDQDGVEGLRIEATSTVCTGEAGASEVAAGAAVAGATADAAGVVPDGAVADSIVVQDGTTAAEGAALAC
jgi:hypothetical protein